MKRYLVFIGYKYYASGGWNDFKGSFDSLEEAVQFAIEYPKKSDTSIKYEENEDWFQVIDGTTGTFVEKMNKSYC